MIPTGWYILLYCHSISDPVLLHMPSRSFQNHDVIYTLWIGSAIWSLRYGSTLAEAMVCCSTAPSHYLIECVWLVISRLLWHSHEISFTGHVQHSILAKEIKDYTFGSTVTSLRVKWVRYTNHFYRSRCQNPYTNSLTWIAYHSDGSPLQHKNNGNPSQAIHVGKL